MDDKIDMLFYIKKGSYIICFEMHLSMDTNDWESKTTKKERAILYITLFQLSKHPSKRQKNKITILVNNNTHLFTDAIQLVANDINDLQSIQRNLLAM